MVENCKWPTSLSELYKTKAIQTSVSVCIFSELSENENNKDNPVCDKFQQNGAFRNTFNENK